MEMITYMLENNAEEIVLIFAGSILVLLFIIIFQGMKISKMANNYKKTFKGANINNIEDLLMKYNKDIDNIKVTNQAIIKDINRIQIDLNNAFSKSALINYDALSDRAGKLSFVYALLNCYNTGIIINGIYNNEGHYLYLKKINNGNCERDLTKEENQVLIEAMKVKE